MSKRDNLTLATVAYADIFNYPLTRPELTQWAIGTTRVALSSELAHGKLLGMTYVFLAGKSGLMRIRRQRHEIAQEKWRKATNAANRFRWISTVQLIGVTGGLAMENAKKDDDIDFFFVVSKGTLWVTRLLATLTAEWFRMRRRPGEREVANKVCLNMFMTENALGLPNAERDLFSAHEVLQMRPLWERQGAYGKFLSANRWVRKLLPNAWEERNRELGIMNHGKKKVFGYSFIMHYSYFILRLFEPLARFLQLWYMQRHRTTEVITTGVIRFHPKDARRWVRQKFAARLKRYNIPLDRIFYTR